MRIAFHEDRVAFEPGEELAGTVAWELDQAPRAVELRLFWFTRGKGTEDVGVVETVRFDNPRGEDTRTFRMKLPGGPYSFSGKLISLSWAVELVSEAPTAVKRMEFILGPQGREVRLDTVPEREEKKGWFSHVTGQPTTFRMER